MGWIIIIFICWLLIVIWVNNNSKEKAARAKAYVAQLTEKYAKEYAHTHDNLVYDAEAGFYESDTNIPYYMIFDCETTGKPGSGVVVRIVQLAWVILDKDFRLVKKEKFYLNPGKPIPPEAILIHHITDEIVGKYAKPHAEVLEKFYSDLESVSWIIAHNFEFDADRVDLESRKAKLGKKSLLEYKNAICTMKRGTNYCKLTPKIYGKYKWPKLEELASCCGFHAENTHDALNDALIAAKCFEAMVEDGYIRRKGINSKA
jgi:DNA polymerase III epsilon subunit-like protein